MAPPESLVLILTEWQLEEREEKGLTIEIANKAVADCGESGELGTGIEGGLQTPTLPFLASSNSVRTWSYKDTASKAPAVPLGIR